jgi:hypothetical protein
MRETYRHGQAQGNARGHAGGCFGRAVHSRVPSTIGEWDLPTDYALSGARFLTIDVDDN